MDLIKTPIYQQLTQALRQLIRGGEFAGGVKFLTEREVSERFAVSRTTANKALSSLVSEGLLEFKKGVGTFVRNGVLDYDLQSLVSFTGKAEAVRKRPTTRVLRFQRLKADVLDADIRDALNLSVDDAVFYMERLRLADGKPVIFEHRYVVGRYCPDLKKSDLTGSLYALLTQRYQLTIAGADQVIRAIRVSGDQAQRLKLPNGSACLEVVSTGALISKHPLWWERTIYRGDAYEFRNHLGGIEATRPATGALLE